MVVKCFSRNELDQPAYVGKRPIKLLKSYDTALRKPLGPMKNNCMAR